MLLYKSSLVLIYLFATAFANFGVVFKGHVGSKPGWGFQGKLFRNTSTVSISPDSRAIPVRGISKSMAICGYTVHRDMSLNFPFIILLRNKGYFEIKLTENIKRENLKSLYTFQIEAFDCDTIPHYSERKFVLVEIKSIQVPIFTSSSYHFLAKVTTAVGTKIGSVVAFERPEKIELAGRSQGICKYRIISPSPVPFTIDKSGSLIAKVLVLDGVKSARYRFTVQADDCREPYPTSSTVPVEVDVFDDCEPHWTGLPSNMEYNVDKGVLPILLDKSVAPSLHLCSRNCQNLQATVTVKLEGNDIRAAKTSLCKFDENSLQRQAQLCEVSKNAVDLMVMAPKLLADSTVGGYFFDGKLAVKLESKFNKFGHNPDRKFSILFWMKHDKMDQGGPKEQILCNSDGQEHNRHHLSLFLHNCKLILLFRREFGESKREEYEPSEWRYGPLEEVCDSNWHHYAVTFNNGSVTLQIDGEMTKESPQYLNDKPMFELWSGSQDTRLTMAACYHSKTDNFVQYFRGNLASLKILDSHLEASNNIRCMATCGEALLLPHVTETVDHGSSVNLLSDSIVIRSGDIYNLLKIFSGLSYLNTEVLDEIRGRQALDRIVTVSTEINCEGTKIYKVEPRSIKIHLTESNSKKTKLPLPIAIFTNSKIQGFENERIPLFADMNFIKFRNTIDSLESCIIHTMAQDIQHWEYLEWPIDLVINNHMTCLNNTHGIFLEGRQPLRNYEMILKKIYYVTRRATAKNSERIFALSCSIAGKLVTKDAIVGVTVKQRDLKTYYVVDDPTQDKDNIKNGIELQGQGGGSIIHEKKSLTNKAAIVKKSPTTAVWVILGCLMVVLVGTVTGLILFFRKFKNPTRKVFLNDYHERRQDRMKVTPNPLVTEGVVVGEVEMADNDSLADDVPDSGDDFDEEECGEGLDDEIRRDRITIPQFFRIPAAVHNPSVDV